MSGDTLEAAKSAITQAGLVPAATTTERYDPDVALNAVSGTSPRIGTSVAKGGKVTIILSKGPALIALPSLTGKTEAEAKSAITDAHFLVGSPIIRQFDPKIDKGLVVDYLGSDGKSPARPVSAIPGRSTCAPPSASPPGFTRPDRIPCWSGTGICLPACTDSSRHGAQRRKRGRGSYRSG